MADMVKQTLTVSGMHCASCSLLIEGELEDIGVKARCNWAAHTVEVEYDPVAVTMDDISLGVKKAGYTVQEAIKK